jgi:aryl-alcohol dehydrogenase
MNGHFFGQSSFATHSITTADTLVKVPDEAPLELLGPIACGLATGAGAILNEARPRLGDSVLIVGVGAVGLAAIMAARNSGVTKIIAADVHDNRLAMARELVRRTRSTPGRRISSRRIGRSPARRWTSPSTARA